MNKILVTGANGFVGSALCQALEAAGIDHTAAMRVDNGGPRARVVGELDGATDWRAALAGCDTVIHLAARVHVMDERAADPLALFRKVNVDATLHLAREALAHGVRRFVYVSSVKVNGEASGARPFSASDTPAPCDPYGLSKLEAEQGLLALAAGSALEVVIVRPPLVYGPGVKANFLQLIKLVRKGVPLPFALVRNRRSMVALGNLVDLLLLVARHANAPGKVFMVSDGADLSTPQLIAAMAAALGRPPRLWPVPAALLRGGARLLGKGAVADRVLGSLQVDIGPTCAALGWRPPLAPQAAIAETVAHHLRAG